MGAIKKIHVYIEKTIASLVEMTYNPTLFFNPKCKQKGSK
jgi:hypothetical protein